jgi:hypothetical protein
MELDPKYVDVMVRRWQDFSGGQATRQSDGVAFAAASGLGESRVEVAAADVQGAQRHFVVVDAEQVVGAGHPANTHERADTIHVMEQGRIVERGTHAELLALNGHYARLHAMQFRETSGETVEES